MGFLRCLPFLLGLIGVVVTVLSVVIYNYFPSVVENKVREKLPLAKDSDAIKRWSKVKVPIYFKLYFFDVVNANDVMEKGDIPQVQEKGPYVFRETKERDTIEYYAEGRIISFRDMKGFIFESERSIGPLDETVTVVDPTFHTVVQKLAKGAYLTEVVDKVTSSVGHKPFNTFTIRELINGYDIKTIKAMHQDLSLMNVNELGSVKQRFGILLGKNLSDDSPKYTIDSGISDLTQIGQIKSFNKESKLNYWESPYCNMINGTDGSMFKPGLQSHEHVEVFNAELCRSISLVFKKVNYIHDIRTNRYHLPHKFFAAPNSDPENKCFCTKKSDTEEYKYCSMDGVLDVSSCRDGAPIYVSSPHFFKGSVRLFEEVRGLEPKEELHETFLDIEPMTGVVLNAARRIQINVLMKFHPIKHSLKLKTQLMPFAWVEEGATVDAHSAGLLKEKIFNKLHLGFVVSIAGMIAGVLLILLSAILWRWNQRRQHVIPPKYTKCSKAHASSKVDDSYIAYCPACHTLDEPRECDCGIAISR